MKINNLIDPSAQMIQSYQRGDNLNQQAVEKQAGTVAAATERVDLSSSAKDIQVAKAIVSGLPDVRDDRVQELKTRIEQGSYTVDISKLANKMVSESLIDILA